MASALQGIQEADTPFSSLTDHVDLTRAEAARQHRGRMPVDAPTHLARLHGFLSGSQSLSSLAALPLLNIRHTQGERNMKSDEGEKIGSSGLAPAVGLIPRLLEIIAAEGLIKPELLDSHAQVDEIGFTIDDLTLIGNAIEREFDCDMMPDEAMQQCRTVRELVVLIGRRIQSAGTGD
ncbi:hypothetical protein ASE61_13515 [Bosea sp. Root670]|uniref:hypothetical protein n=1 Tax=Bosea sp. Root670 TaxID=1736583 RepID=UPI000715B50D|nr:hypothetical protein [Bosea sp. Root670]KRE03476.1 hypothetical protein ASE61_13515 [Bosea sp. Root670]